jgi:IPT/TIG domain
MCNLAEATMSRISLGLLLAITLMGPACGYSHNYMNGTGMPNVTQLSPSSTAAGGAAFTLTVQGSGFGTDSLVYWGTTTRTTTYDSASEVTADITAADIMNAGSVQVYVHSGGANSNAMTFTITP